jgi:hypothetical protein
MVSTRDMPMPGRSRRFVTTNFMVRASYQVPKIQFKYNTIIVRNSRFVSVVYGSTPHRKRRGLSLMTPTRNQATTLHYAPSDTAPYSTNIISFPPSHLISLSFHPISQPAVVATRNPHDTPQQWPQHGLQGYPTRCEERHKWLLRCRSKSPHSYK